MTSAHWLLRGAPAPLKLKLSQKQAWMDGRNQASKLEQSREHPKIEIRKSDKLGRQNCSQEKPKTEITVREQEGGNSMAAAKGRPKPKKEGKVARAHPSDLCDVMTRNTAGQVARRGMARGTGDPHGPFLGILRRK